jgi:hypothetical protein
VGPPLLKKAQVRAGFVGYHGPGSCVRVSTVSADIASRLAGGATSRREAKPGAGVWKIEPGDLLASDPEAA